MLANLLLQSLIVYAIAGHAAVMHEFKTSKPWTKLGLNSSSTPSSSIRDPSTLKYPTKSPLSLLPPAVTPFLSPENSGNPGPQTQLPDSRSSYSAPIRPREDETPLDLFPIDCNNPSYKEYKRHRDVHHDGVDKGVERFCDSGLAHDTITIVEDVQDHPLHAWRWRYKDKYGVYLDFKVNWKVGCRTSQGFQDTQRPLGTDGPSCDDIMLANWKHCLRRK
ncbi:uncharacterized protein BDZ83DRAFT_776422 [Colletotrichum acutatum]|uniref:Uncharacterized protein n=1 Tax=Glomerella acutata TaxID=27357 RepID=A0AAD8UJY5_GLOAC|nr:uncharacterized protein BDZ83DRAFT_776422 [Colletotrichum acutatum]KAK1725732.1 hypothetical protein BDZ83DRAFT_776422 [Colletotrichum acutatum]